MDATLRDVNGPMVTSYPKTHPEKSGSGLWTLLIFGSGSGFSQVHDRLPAYDYDICMKI